MPFIARYRKEVTGNMMPDALREFKDQYDVLKYIEFLLSLTELL